MRPKIGKFLTVSIVLAYILTSALFPQTIATPATPKISVEPASNVFGTDTASVGTTFTVDIVTSGWEDPGLFSFELKFYYDPTLLGVVEASYPPGHFLPPPNFEVPVDINEEKGYILFGVTKLGDVPGSTGDGTLGTVTFEIIKAPPPALSCDLELKDIVFLDPQGNEVLEYDVENGYYEFSPPKAPVYLYITPKVASAATAGELVEIDIAINDLRAEDKLVGIEWKLRFDPDLLEYFNSTEGDFLKSEAEQAAAETGEEYGAVFMVQRDPGTDFVICFNFYYKDPWPPEIFPGTYSQGGTLATITFTAIEMPEETTETDLELFDVIMIDVDENEILYDHIESGVYIAPTEPGDLNLDRKIDIQDLYIFGSAFGSDPDHPRWDVRADINSDNKVNMLDGVIIAKAFHA